MGFLYVIAIHMIPDGFWKANIQIEHRCECHCAPIADRRLGGFRMLEGALVFCGFGRGKDPTRSYAAGSPITAFAPGAQVKAGNGALRPVVRLPLFDEPWLPRPRGI